jgi:hypothetical protein
MQCIAQFMGVAMIFSVGGLGRKSAYKLTFKVILFLLVAIRYSEYNNVYILLIFIINT